MPASDPRLDPVIPMFIVTAFLAALAPPWAAAQGLTGQISGRIEDPSGRPVSEAIVRLSGIETRGSRERKTGDSGEFVFTEVLPVTFALSVEVPGFRKFEQQRVFLP